MTMTPVDPSAITTLDVRDFLIDKQTSELCSACGSDQLKLMDTWPDVLVSLRMDRLHPSAPKVKDEVLPVAVVACQNCGCFRLHAVAAIVEWKRNRRG